MDKILAQGNLKKNDFWKYGLCQNHCIVAASCKPTEIITLERCFWKELTTSVTTYKNEEVIEHTSMTIIVGPHQAAPYGYWHHINNQIGKESIFINIGSNNFLEGTNYNYSCCPLNKPINPMEDFAMPEIRTINGTASYSTIVIQNNIQSNSVGIKSLSGFCDLKIQDKAGSMIIISIDKGSYRFFADLYGISCEFMGEGNYINCSDKTPEIIRPKDQGFDEAAEKIVNITSDNSKFRLIVF
jgi:hypothetical protein